MRRLLAVIFSVVVLAAAPPASSQVEFAADGPVLQLQLNEGRLVTLPRPVNFVYVGNPGIVDVDVNTSAPQLMNLVAVGVGETTVSVIDGNGEVMINRRIQVEPNVAKMLEIIEAVIPGYPIKAQAVNGTVLLEGTVDTSDQAETIRGIAERFVGDPALILNRLTVDTPNQVHIRVRVAEVRRDLISQLGIDWQNIAATFGQFSLGLATGNTGVADTILFQSFNQRNILSGGNLGDPLTLGANNDLTLGLNAVIDALANNDLVTLLAEPNLTTLSGENGSILIGGEIPYLVPQQQSITVEFREFGIRLDVTPTVISNDRINLLVAPEVSELTSDGAVDLLIAPEVTVTTPAFRVRRAESTVELGSGQSFVLGGLISADMEQSLAKVPGLGDLPVLGRLFQSETYRRRETELLIIVTPYLVRPADRKDLITAQTDLPLRSDVEGWLGQPREGPPADSRGNFSTSPNQTPEPMSLSGPVGYVME